MVSSVPTCRNIADLQAGDRFWRAPREAGFDTSGSDQLFPLKRWVSIFIAALDEQVKREQRFAVAREAMSDGCGRQCRAVGSGGVAE